MVTIDGERYFNTWCLIPMLFLGSLLIWRLARTLDEMRLNTLLTLYVLHVVYHLNDLHPNRCSGKDIRNTAGMTVECLFMGEISVILPYLVNDGALQRDEETDTYTLTPRGRHILEHGFPTVGRPPPPPPDDGHTA